jgi:uncharacterized membrane protein
MDKRKLAVASAATIALASLVAYALIQYYGQVQITVPVEQAVWVDGKRFNETITETFPPDKPIYGGSTAYANHTLENRGDAEAKVKFVLVNITDSKGIPVTDNTVSVTWLLEGNPIIQPLTIPAHATVNFTIAISFHYAIMPDTYTVTVQVEPYVP